MNDLLDPAGILHPVLERVRVDDTLMLAIRKNYINIYYRGGNLLRVKKGESGIYTAFFDNKYCNYGLLAPELPGIIENHDASRRWVDSFQTLKLIMDIYFTHHRKPEREFQQLLVRENNFSCHSNQSEYFIVDIEFADKALGARFDALAVYWSSSNRKDPSYTRPVFIEMKYGDSALSGSSGIVKHLNDIDSFVSDREKYEVMVKTMETQFNQLDELGLMNFKRGKGWKGLSLNPNVNPEVIFIFANHNPRSSKLLSLFDSHEIEKYVNTKRFDLKFYVSTFAGYALHGDSMMGLEEFRRFLKWIIAEKRRRNL